jgi:hypothetical protein
MVAVKKSTFERNLDLIKYALENPFATRKDIAEKF